MRRWIRRIVRRGCEVGHGGGDQVRVFMCDEMGKTHVRALPYDNAISLGVS